MSVSSISRPGSAGAGDAALPCAAGVGPSPRLRLARLARDTALRVGGVLALAPGEDGRFAVVSGEERIDGVLCVATAGGGYDVAVQLVCALVPLVDLGERVRAQVRESATAAGLPLATVSVHVAGVAGPGEV
jgi:hypothetical protein